MKPTNRCQLARENAGLSIGQAARLLGVPADQLRSIEECDAAFAGADQPRLADLYGVNLDWLFGRVAQSDHVAIKQIPGASELPFRDRDMIAELLASRPRKAPP